MNSITIKIDFSEIGGPIFSGRKKGEINRNKYNLDKEDQSEKTIKIVIPDNTYAVTSGFFLGLFGKSIHHLGGKAQFLKKYDIKAPDRIKEKIDCYIERAIR